MSSPPIPVCLSLWKSRQGGASGARMCWSMQVPGKPRWTTPSKSGAHGDRHGGAKLRIECKWMHADWSCTKAVVPGASACDASGGDGRRRLSQSPLGATRPTQRSGTSKWQPKIQACGGFTRSNEVVAVELYTIFDHLLHTSPIQAVEGFSDSDSHTTTGAMAVMSDDTQSYCFMTKACAMAPADMAATLAASSIWACKSCGDCGSTMLLHFTAHVQERQRDGRPDKMGSGIFQNFYVIFLFYSIIN